MPNFSQRYGYTPIEQFFQRERVDNGLRVALWNVLSAGVWNRWMPAGATGGVNTKLRALSKRLWLVYFNRDIDQLPIFKGGPPGSSAYSNYKDYFFRCEWFYVYNFIQFLIQEDDTLFSDDIIKALNNALETQNAAYRIVSKEVTEITDDNEIRAVEDALNHSDAPIRAHKDSVLFTVLPAMRVGFAIPCWRSQVLPTRTPSLCSWPVPLLFRIFVPT